MKKPRFIAAIFFFLGLIASSQAASLSSFLDVDPEAYYYEGVEAMVSLGVMQGYDESTFGPEDPITRGQFATSLDRYNDQLLILLCAMDYDDAEESVQSLYATLCPDIHFSLIAPTANQTFRIGDTTRIEWYLVGAEEDDALLFELSPENDVSTYWIDVVSLSSLSDMSYEWTIDYLFGDDTGEPITPGTYELIATLYDGDYCPSVEGCEDADYPDLLARHSVFITLE